MPVNFQQVYREIRQIAAGASERRQALETRRALALTWLNEQRDRTAELRDKVERAALADPTLRCALPVAGLLDASHPTPDSTPPFDLLAADGSQIAPDRHAPVQYALINVGTVLFHGASTSEPAISTVSEFYFDEQIEGWTDGLVALKRDLAERQRLLELAQERTGPVVTLTDGPLQLWEAQESAEARAGYEEALQKYLGVLSRLRDLGATVAGYVDKPASNLLPRLLEVASADEADLARLRAYHPLAGVSDRWLFAQFLPAGARSAIFALQSRSRDTYSGALALHFFFLNVGAPGRPQIARVEVPAWVAEDERRLDALHAQLLAQCRILGARPYPYILHRAHETALVSRDEKDQIDRLLQIELRRQGLEVEAPSGKQAVKESGSRTRYRT